MTLIKTSILNAIAFAVKVLTLIGLNKILAVYVGPVGYAAIGQLQNAVQVIVTFAAGAINNGVVKYTAEYTRDGAKESTLWRTAGSIALVGSAIISVVLVVFSSQMAAYFLGDAELGGVFYWFAIGLVFFSLNALLLAILNGRQQIAVYVIANIAGSLLSLVVSSVLTISFGLYGALVSIVTYQSFSFIATFFLISRLPWFNWRLLVGEFDVQIAAKLGRFALMALVSAVCVPLVQMLVRSHLISAYGYESAGYWDAMVRLSSSYLLLVTMTLGVYYLPKLSELQSAEDIASEIKRGYRVIVPVTILGCLVVFVFRDFIISMLFTDKFSPMRELFAGQVTGDALKICSWIIAYVMVSKSMLKVFIATEIFSGLMFYVLTLMMSNFFGFSGVSWAYALNYLIYSVIVYFFVYRRLDSVSAVPRDNVK